MSGAVILALRPKEYPHADIAHIASVYRNLSPQAAQQIMARALGELAETMTDLAERIARRDLADMNGRLRQLERMAKNLGLSTLAGVTRDVSRCLKRADPTAFAAVWARLMRMLDSVLRFEQDMQDMNSH